MQLKFTLYGAWVVMSGKSMLHNRMDHIADMS